MMFVRQCGCCVNMQVEETVSKAKEDVKDEFVDILTLDQPDDDDGFVTRLLFCQMIGSFIADELLFLPAVPIDESAEAEPHAQAPAQAPAPPASQPTAATTDKVAVKKTGPLVYMLLLLMQQ